MFSVWSLSAGSLMLSSVSVFLIYAVKTKSQSILMSCVFSGVSVISWNALDVVGTELYPTQLRYLSSLPLYCSKYSEYFKISFLACRMYSTASNQALLHSLVAPLLWASSLE